MHHPIDQIILDALNKNAPEGHEAKSLVYGAHSTVTAVVCGCCPDNHPIGQSPLEVAWDKKFLTYQQMAEKVLKESKQSGWEGHMGTL